MMASYFKTQLRRSDTRSRHSY